GGSVRAGGRWASGRMSFECEGRRRQSPSTSRTHQHRPCGRGPSEVLPFLLSPVRETSVQPRFAAGMVRSLAALFLTLLTALCPARLSFGSQHQVELPELAAALPQVSSMLALIQRRIPAALLATAGYRLAPRLQFFEPLEASGLHRRKPRVEGSRNVLRL